MAVPVIPRVLAAVGLAAALATGCTSAPDGVSSGGGLTGQVCCVAPGGGPDVVDGVATAHDGWDNAFISYMAPHDAVAGQLAELALTRATSPEIRDLAREIDTAPQQRYLRLSAMATAWGQPAPSTDPAAAAGHDHGGGRTEADDVAALTALTGAAFDREFLTVFVRHHQAGLEVAQATIDNGTNPQAAAVAQDIVTTQTAELARMQQLQRTVA